MPRFVVTNAMRKITRLKKIPIYGNHIIPASCKKVIAQMAAVMKVSYTACMIRLRQLDLFEKHDVDEFIRDEIGGEFCYE